MTALDRDRKDDPANQEPSTWVTLREASVKSAVSVATLRRWYRADKIRSRLDDGENGRRRLVVLEEVLARAKRSTGEEVVASPPSSDATLAPPDRILVPVDAWEKALSQLGDLHQADSRLAEALERAAKAETERDFLRERLRELQRRLEHLQALVQEGELNRISQADEGPAMGEDRIPDSHVEDVKIEWRNESSEKEPDRGFRWSWKGRS
jgi:hypothetical protein